ncbi:MAG: Zn-dependent hydrolase [Bacteroidales bacterium]|nr:Zn-dependent hydrolase [Bacteroidales bacterium]
MKNKLLLISSLVISVLLMIACQAKEEQAESSNQVIQEKVDAFAKFQLTTDLSTLSESERKMIPLLIQAAEIMDQIYWQEAYGDKDELFSKIEDSAIEQFAMINYGPWERLQENTPFIEGYDKKPLGSQFYPTDMSKEEFDAWDEPSKASLYTMIRRDKDGNLIAIPYHIYFKEETQKAVDLILLAAELAEDEGLKNYLELRAEALLTDEYLASDLAWMDMKTNNIDFVVGPIENYEDALYGHKAAHESFVLIKDTDWSQKLDRFVALLPKLQASLPVSAEYKTEVPGSGSDLGVYDVIYYGGDCNAGSKTIAINLPNDERVHLEKGSRKLQLKNSMQAKFDKILIPIANELMAEDQRKHVTFDAFFENTMFHEVGHGLGIKNTINGKGPVRKALSDQYSAFEEGKADILGLFLVTKLTEMGEMGEKDLMDNFTTFMAGIFRSIRFGATSSHGKANMVRFNYFQDKGAFTRDASTGTYSINFDVMYEAMLDLSNTILVIQGNGDYDAAKKILDEKGYIQDQLQADLDRLKAKGIPKDIVFEQGTTVLGL